MLTRDIQRRDISKIMTPNQDASYDILMNIYELLYERHQHIIFAS